MRLLFSPLPDPKPRRKVFLTSFVVECLALLFAINFGLFFPPKFVLPERYTITSLVTYQPPVSHEPQPAPPPVLPKPLKLPPPPVEAKLEAPPLPKALPKPLPKPKPPEAKVSAPAVRTAPERLPELAAARPVPKIVVTNTFSTGSSAAPTTNRPAAKVQTGGFGDPNGVPTRATNGNAVNINARGSPGLPSGPGNGNGLGGAKGSPGVVASAGFGNGTAVGSPKGGGRGTVQEGGFGDAKVVAQAPQKKPGAASSTTPVEIVYKPKPNYTQEGRALKIEGEVRLEVNFTAAGQVHVIRVLQGLGHGLDEQAVRAAEQVRFRPAQRQGQPVDYTATLHIIFQLA